MSAAWLLYTMIVGVAVALAAYAAESLCRQLRLPSRWVWAASMALLFVLVAARSWPERNQPIDLNGLTPRSVAAGDAAEAAGNSFLSSIATTLALTGTVSRELIAGAVRRLPRWLSGGAGALLAAAALIAVATLVLVHLRLRRARRHWPRAELHATPVRIAPSVGPAVIGVLRPEIVVPRWLLERSAAEQRLVLEHEREHLRRGDHLLLGAAGIAVALVPWHPAVWWMLARLRLAIELDCDARVLRRGISARAYGALLIDLAGRCSGFRVGATALADESSHLERRLLAMHDTRSRTSILRPAALASATALLLLVACESKLPTSAEIQSMDVAGVEKVAVRSQLLARQEMGDAVFYVDGVRTTEQEAGMLPPDAIASMMVEKRGAGAGPSIIRITTNGKRARSSSALGEWHVKVQDTLGGGHVVAERQAMRSTNQRARTETFTFDARDTTKTRSREFTGLLFVNGVKVDPSVLGTLDEKQIAAIEVIKGESARRLSNDPAAANGVIRITTKQSLRSK